MTEKNINQEFTLKYIDEERNYSIEEIDQNELISKVCWVLNYIEHLLILVSTVTECVFISDFVSSFGISVGITSSTIGLKIYSITAWIKRYKSIVKKKKKKLEKIVLLAKTKLNSIEVLKRNGWKNRKRKTMLSSTCAVYGSRKLRFLKEKEANELLSSLGIKTFSSQVPRLGPFLC